MLKDHPETEHIEVDGDSKEEASDSDSENDSDTEVDSLSNDDDDVDDKDEDIDDEDKEKTLVDSLRNTKDQKPLEAPNDIKVQAVDIKFHPKSEILALAKLSGEIALYSYGCEENILKENLKIHDDSCRCVNFSESGDHMYSVAKDSCIVVTDINTCKEIVKFKQAHESSIYSQCIIGRNYLATGDDDGCVKLWDIRKEGAICSWDEQEDYVSCMIVDSAKRTLICSSGDGTIIAYNVKSRKLMTQSEEYDCEPTCLALVNSETKLAVGTVGKKNPIYFFNYDQYGYHSDKLNGHSNGLSCMLSASEHIIITSDDYGTLRAVHVFPHRYLGVIGRHHRGFGIDAISLSCDSKYLASCGQDEIVSFWNVEYLENMERSSFKKTKGKIFQQNLPSSRQQNTSEFFANM